MCVSKGQNKNVAKIIWKKKILSKLTPKQNKVPSTLLSKELEESSSQEKMQEKSPLTMEQRIQDALNEMKDIPKPVSETNEKEQQALQEISTPNIPEENPLIEEEKLREQDFDQDMEKLRAIQNKKKMIRELAFLFSRIY